MILPRAAAQRSSPVAKAKVSPAARQKAITRRAKDGQPVHSFRTLLQDLANLTRNSVLFGDAHPTIILARPRPQSRFGNPSHDSIRSETALGRTRSQFESHQSLALNILGSSV